MTTRSGVEAKAQTHVAAAGTKRVLKGMNGHLEYRRPGEGDATQPGGPINWHEMEDDEYEETWGALCDFLRWALPHWGFTSEQIPAACWWQHRDVIEELTAWWGLWQAGVRNAAAPIANQMTFQEQTFQLKQRLEHTYRGRCRHEHQPQAVLVIDMPD